jgi:1-acyl-sn-glycerol-3-phosphate acyltransferase
LYNRKVPGWWGKFLYYLSKWIVYGLARLYFRISVDNITNMPRRGKLLLASNHVSHLDPPLIGSCCPRMVFHMAKVELTKVGFLRSYMRAIGTILVDRQRGRQAVGKAVERLNEDACVVIFPEGTRSRDGRLMRGRHGAALIAIQSNCPILPCAIIGSERAMTKGSRFIKPVKVQIRFGKPFSIDYEGDVNEIPREILETGTRQLMEQIEELLPQHMHTDPGVKSQWYGSPTDAVS